jgi:DNA-binding winged helix-turn-helix (wHTH) protein
LPTRVGVGMSRGMNNGMNNGMNSGANGGTARSLERAGATGPIAARRGGVSCERSLDVVVCRLRRVIEVEPSRPKFLQTVRGFGYVFNPSGGGTSARAPDVTANATANVTAKVTTRQLPHSRQSQPVHHSHQSAQHQEAIQNTVRRAAANADTARSINPWFSAISFPMQYPASEDLGSRSPA